MSLSDIIPAHIDPAPLKLPMFASRVSAGFPAASDDHMDPPLDLNEFLVKKPSATYFVHTEGDSLKDININDGDLLIVDRTLPRVHRAVVIAVVHGELTCKILDLDKLQLLSANELFKPIPMPEDLVIEGVVTYCIKCHLRSSIPYVEE